jgi:hypothetical protein
MYVGRKSENPKQKQFMTALIIFLGLWLLIASILDKSPVRIIIDGWAFLVDAEENEWQTFSDLEEQIVDKDSLIRMLNQDIDRMKKANNYQQGMVAVESETLNMRNKPLLGAEVIIQIPMGSVVDILYYDDETFRIGGEYGQWCKVRYAGKEGWVWGNYLEKIN